MSSTPPSESRAKLYFCLTFKKHTERQTILGKFSELLQTRMNSFFILRITEESYKPTKNSELNGLKVDLIFCHLNDSSFAHIDQSWKRTILTLSVASGWLKISAVRWRSAQKEPPIISRCSLQSQSCLQMWKESSWLNFLVKITTVL